MRRLFLIALACATAPASVSAQNQPDTDIPGGIGLTTTEVFRSYAMDPRTVSPKETLARLNRLCESKRRFDQQRCEESWRLINAAHTRLQAERAAKR